MLHQFRGISRVATGDVEGGLGELRDVYEEATRSDISASAMSTFVNLGYWTWWAEGPQEGAELFRGGIEWCKRRGIPVEWAETELTWALFDLGEWDDVLARTDKLLAEAQAEESAVLETMARPTRGRILLARGNLAEARVDADASVALVEATEIPQSIVPTLTLAAAVATAEGDLQQAAAYLRQLEERTRGRLRSRGIEVAEAARVAAAVGDPSAVQQILADPHPPLLRAEAQWTSARAVLAEAEEAFGHAIGLYRQAAEAWTSFGHLLERAHAYAGGGRCALAVGEGGTAELHQARDLFTRLGARRHIAAVDELLGGSAAAVSS
jgi:tetratricopeptide (TPR) repeat protein